MNRYILTLIILFFTLSGCKKKEESPEFLDEYSYEVACESCDIEYTNQEGNTQKVINNRGAWTFTIKIKLHIDLTLKITSKSTSLPYISAYIVKNGEVIYGDLGYTYLNLSYNTRSGRGNITYGSNNNGNNGGGSGSGSGGGTSTPTSSVCGAKNKTGGYCKRVVVGGGRCWQHK